MKTIFIGLAILSLSSGCFLKKKSSVRIPIVNNPGGAHCHSDCLGQLPNRKSYITCMATCPGAVKQHRECTTADQPPYAICDQETAGNGITKKGETWEFQAQVEQGCGVLRPYQLPTAIAPAPASAPTALQAQGNAPKSGNDEIAGVQ